MRELEESECITQYAIHVSSDLFLLIEIKHTKLVWHSLRASFSSSFLVGLALYASIFYV